MTSFLSCVGRVVSTYGPIGGGDPRDGAATALSLRQLDVVGADISLRVDSAGERAAIGITAAASSRHRAAEVASIAMSAIGREPARSARSTDVEPVHRYALRGGRYVEQDPRLSALSAVRSILAAMAKGEQVAALHLAVPADQIAVPGDVWRPPRRLPELVVRGRRSVRCGPPRRTRPSNRRESTVPVGGSVLTQEPLRPWDRHRLAIALSEDLGQKIDLVEVSGASPLELPPLLVLQILSLAGPVASAEPTQLSLGSW